MPDPTADPADPPRAAGAALLHAALCAALVALGSALAAVPVHAQETLDSSAVRLHTFALWSGSTLGTGRLLGRARDVQLGELALRYARVLSVGKRVALRYTADLAVLRLRYGGFDVRYRYRSPSGAVVGERDGVLRVDGEARAVGLTPLGLQHTLWPRRRVRLSLGASLGVLYFGERVPEEQGRKLNFKIGAGLSLEAALTEALALRLGYHYTHVSNAFRGEVNPGFEASMLRLGVAVHQ